MNRKLVQSDFSSHLAMYDRYEVSIKRVDAIRLFILYRYGGLYMDLDFLCLRPFESLPYLPDGMAVFGMQDERVAANAFMAAPPGHPFIAFLISQLNQSAKRQVFDATGPYFLTRALAAWRQKYGKLSNESGVVAHPFPRIYNNDPRNARSHPCGLLPDMHKFTSRTHVEACAALLNTSFVTTFWTQTWRREVANATLHGDYSVPHMHLAKLRTTVKRCATSIMGDVCQMKVK